MEEGVYSVEYYRTYIYSDRVFYCVYRYRLLWTKVELLIILR